MNQQLPKTASRVLYLDYLRVMAAFAVILLHVSGQPFYDVDINSSHWMVLNLADSMTRWAVSLFVMISGALFLDPDRKVTIQKLCSRNLLRIVTAFFFWSGFYALYNYVTHGELRQAASIFLHGEVHMWYLYLAAILYILTPVLRPAAAGDTLTKYLLIVLFLLQFVIPQLLFMAVTVEIPYITEIIRLIQTSWEELLSYFPTGYLFYYLLGSYLARHEISRKARRLVYLAGILSYLFTAAHTHWYSHYIGIADCPFYEEITVNAALMTAAMFLFGKYVLADLRIPDRLNKLVVHMSDCSFGIYLVHIFYQSILRERFHLHAMTFHPIASIPLACAVIFLLSWLTAALLKKIPVLNRYIL